MSATSLDSFISKVATDSQLQQRLAELQAGSPEEALEKVVKISEECGSPVTAEELRSLEWSGGGKGEISTAELEQVSGGGSWLGSLFSASKVGVAILQGFKAPKPGDRYPQEI